MKFLHRIATVVILEGSESTKDLRMENPQWQWKDSHLEMYFLIRTGDFPLTILSLLEGTSNGGKKNLLT